ncbi:MAG: hypothetical protein IIX86_04555 [Clostridia bacterium]|nr:hypothetical protein [Clostridia bacterium]
MIKHIFILNPVAGKGALQVGLAESIAQACAQRGADYEIFKTGARGEATEYVRALCKQYPDASLRFYACGGDGTLSEVVNGAYGYANASVGVVPVGTGNDFVRNFAAKEQFLDIGAQLDGETQKFDLLRYNGQLCVNMINIGFDCEVVKLTAKLKKKKLLSADFGYIAGLVLTLILKPGVKAQVSVDGGAPERRNMLLTSVANGSWCGGGFYSSPLALLSDGVLDVLMIKNVSRVRFLSLVGAYKSGSFVSNPKARRVIDYVKCHRVSYAFNGMQSVCVDGEVTEAKDLEIEAVTDALCLIVPKGASYAPASEPMPVGMC